MKSLFKRKILKWIFISNFPVVLVIFMVFAVCVSADNTLNSLGAFSKSGVSFEGGASSLNLPNVKAKYVGVDDRDTEFSRKVLAQTSRWSNSNNPFYNGYGGLCEAFCYHVYANAGLSYTGSCCAYKHKLTTAKREGKIPKGALIFSGTLPSTNMEYENGHRPSAYCDISNNWAGHIGIYVGNGYVAGSQVPYLWDINTWIEVFGYGGWSYS